MRYCGGMNEPKVTDLDYISFLVASPAVFSCTEAARVQPAAPAAPSPSPRPCPPSRLEGGVHPAPGARAPEPKRFPGRWGLPQVVPPPQPFQLVVDPPPGLRRRRLIQDRLHQPILAQVDLQPIALACPRW